MDSPEAQFSPAFDFLAWFEVNKKRLVQWAAAAAIIGLAAYIWSYQRRQAETEANAALFKVQVPEGGAAGKPATASDLLRVAAQHGGTAAGERAALLGAAALFAEGKFSDAKAGFEQFLGSHPASPLLATAALGVAASLDSLNETERAITEYRRVVAGYPNDLAAAQARLALAALYESKGQHDEARKLYDQLTTGAGQGGFWREEAVSRREALPARPFLPLAPPPVSENKPPPSSSKK
jgi:TolA-binding protein